jgi:hypothetical protein
MSDYESDNDPHSHVEYNPCIRKGKHKPKHKKQKKYEAKVQKMNLIRSKNHKVIYNDPAVFIYNESTLKSLLEILKTKNTYDWNDDYEYQYTSIYKLGDIKEYAEQYEALQLALDYENLQDDYDNNYDDDDWEERYERRYWRRHSWY